MRAPRPTGARHAAARARTPQPAAHRSSASHPTRSATRHALLATCAAGVVALPLIATMVAESPLEAAAATREPATRTVDLSAHLAAYQAATDAAVEAQMAAATAQVAAEQAAAQQAAAQQAAAQQAAAEQAAAQQAAAQQAAAQQAAAQQAAAQQAAAQQAAAQRAAEEQASQARASRSRSAAAADSGDPRSIARGLLAARGQSSQFSCLDRLWSKESGWDTSADNPSSSAYGIPQALPGSKMASAGADWRTSARTQITWGLSYIASSYGSPCAAWSHSQAHNWY